MDELINEYIVAVDEETRLMEQLRDPCARREKDVFIYEALICAREAIIESALAFTKVAAEQHTTTKTTKTSSESAMQRNVYALLLHLHMKGPMSERQLRAQMRSWISVGGFPGLWRLTIGDMIKRSDGRGPGGQKTTIYEITEKGLAAMNAIFDEGKTQ